MELEQRPDEEDPQFDYILGFFYDEPVDNDWQIAPAWLLAHGYITDEECRNILIEPTPNQRWEKLVKVCKANRLAIHEEPGVGVRIYIDERPGEHT